MIDFCIRKTRISIDFSFLAVIALFFSLDGGKLLLYGLFACIIHETGHMIPMICLGEKLSCIKFHAAGIRIIPYKNMIRPIHEDIAVILSGSLLNLFAGVIIFALCGGKDAQVLAGMNIILGLFNLLPYTNFDGGTLILTAAEYYIGDSFGTAKILRYVNCMLSISLIAFLYINKLYNITLTITIIYLIAVEIVGGCKR